MSDTPSSPQPVATIAVPARDIPMPSTISPQARFTLSLLSQVPLQVMPGKGDVEGWAAYMALRARL